MAQRARTKSAVYGGSMKPRLYMIALFFGFLLLAFYLAGGLR